jgi:hypothetical protein
MNIHKEAFLSPTLSSDSGKCLNSESLASIGIDSKRVVYFISRMVLA